MRMTTCAVLAALACSVLFDIAASAVLPQRRKTQPPLAPVQEPQTRTTLPANWRLKEIEDPSGDSRPADTPGLRRETQAVLAVLKETPALASSAVELQVGAYLHGPRWGLLPSARVEITSRGPYDTEGAIVDGIVVGINGLGEILGRGEEAEALEWEPKKGDPIHYWYEPEIGRRADGLMVAHGYEVVLTKRHEPLHVPVTVRTLLKTAVTDWRLGGGNMDDIDQMLATMAPAQLDAQAYANCDGKPRYYPCAPTAPGAKRLVAANPRFFDPKLRLSIQLLTVQRHWEGRYGAERGKYPQIARIFETALREIDWAALDGLLVAGEAAPATVHAVAPVAPEPPAARAATGAEWVTASLENGAPPKSARMAVQEQTRPLVELVKALPSIRGLSSGYMRVATEVNTPGPGEPPGGSIEFGLWRSRRWYEQQSGGDGSFDFPINNTFLLYNDKGMGIHGTGFHLEPRFPRTHKGFPLSETGYTVLTKRKGPMFRGVSVEAVYRAMMADVNMSKESIARWQKMLQALSPEERAADAYGGCKQGYDEIGLCPSDVEGARRIVEENPDFWDRSLPPTAIQLLLVRYGFRQDPKGLGAAVKAAYNEIDWQALYALVR